VSVVDGSCAVDRGVTGADGPAGDVTERCEYEVTTVAWARRGIWSESKVEDGREGHVELGSTRPHPELRREADFFLSTLFPLLSVQALSMQMNMLCKIHRLNNILSDAPAVLDERGQVLKRLVRTGSELGRLALVNAARLREGGRDYEHRIHETRR
jgi:hypothetical protein